MGLKHATKKRFAKAKTRKSAIYSGISAEYSEYVTRLERVSAAIKSLIKQIQATSQVWGAVARHQNAFASALLAALPADGIVRTHAKEVDATVRHLQRMILEDVGSAAPHRRITAVLDAYLTSVDDVQQDYAPVETTYTEVARYQRKVDKLRRKGEKKASLLSANVDKLTAARATHDQKLDAVLARMKTVYEKHEAVFQCAHHAFWIAQEAYSKVINEATKGIRGESMAVREHLVKIDIHSSPKLPPVPRVHMLLPPMSATEISSTPFTQPSPSAVSRPMQLGSETPHAREATPRAAAPTVRYVYATNGEPVSSASGTAGPSSSSEAQAGAMAHAVVHLTPESPSVNVRLPPEQTAQGEEIVPTVQRVSSRGDIVYIPAVPTEMPRMPQMPRMATQQQNGVTYVVPASFHPA